MMYDRVETISRSVVQHGPNNDRVYLMKISDDEQVDFLIDQLHNLTILKRYSKIFAKVPSRFKNIFLAHKAAITLSAVYGFLYLMLYHEIKASKFGTIYKKLPKLETLERMSFTAFKMAFLFLGIAILVGFFWLPRTFPNFSYTDPKLVGTVVLWILYGLGILAKRFGDWKGRRVMILAVCGFGITIFSMIAINILFSGFHNFY